MSRSPLKHFDCGTMFLSALASDVLKGLWGRVRITIRRLLSLPDCLLVYCFRKMKISMYLGNVFFDLEGRNA